MRFYTIQKRSVWNKWNSQGFLLAEERKDDLFKSAYNWMKEQMLLRLPKYEGEPIIWLWTEIPEWYKHWSHIPRKKFVVLTLELDEEDVLISDFDAWHVILNKWQFNDGEGWDRVFDLEWVRENYLEEGEKQELQATTGKIDLAKVVEVDFFTTKKSV